MISELYHRPQVHSKWSVPFYSRGLQWAYLEFIKYLHTKSLRQGRRVSSSIFFLQWLLIVLGEPLRYFNRINLYWEFEHAFVVTFLFLQNPHKNISLPFLRRKLRFPIQNTWIAPVKCNDYFARLQGQAISWPWQTMTIVEGTSFFQAVKSGKVFNHFLLFRSFFRRYCLIFQGKLMKSTG